MKKFRDYLKEQLKDPAFRKAYEAERNRTDLGRLMRSRKSRRERIHDLTPEQARKMIQERVWKHFVGWMSEQTSPVLEGRDGKPIYGFFKHDVKRYLEGILEGKPTYFD